MAKDRLTLEVFRDAHDYEPESTSIDALLLGVSGLEKIIGKIDTIATDRMLPLPHANSTRMDFLDLTKDIFRADLNIVANKRPIHIPGQYGPTAISTVTPNNTKLGMRLAVVPAKHRHAEFLTQHEILHLLNVKTSGEKFDGEAHCTDRKCNMYPTGYATEVCGECHEQAIENHDYLLDAKKGGNISSSLVLPPAFDELKIHQNNS